MTQMAPAAVSVAPKQVQLPNTINVTELATLLGVPTAQVIKSLLGHRIMANINSQLDYGTAQMVAEDLGVEVLEPETPQSETEEASSIAAHRLVLEEEEADLVPRPPVVTIMGHVDHGKTSLLDAIREANVAEGEVGGITQHIGAYQVEKDGRTITFIDTPGHAAFTAMRARGAQVTDVAVIVVAADDGVMPQTVESIAHARAAGVPFIIAINKIDRPNANPDRVRQQLSSNGVLVTGWGGEVETVEVSALQRLGLDDLLEMILLVSDLEEPKANPKRPAVGTVIEAKLDRSRGPVATVLVQNGTLHANDFVVVNRIAGRVRAMTDFRGNRLKEAGPSTPVEIIGLESVPAAGDRLTVVPDERSMRSLIEERTQTADAEAERGLSLDDLLAQIQLGETKELNLILKADVQGSVEAIRGALERLNADNQATQVRILYDAVGAPTEWDVNLAAASKAIIVAFNVRLDAGVKAFAEQQGVEIRQYQIIYNLLEDVEKALSGLVEPTFREVVYGHAEVLAVFRAGRGEAIVGCRVRDGVLRRGAGARVGRGGEVVYNGRISSLRRFKEDVREVNAGYECGVGLENWPDPREGDVIEVFGRERI
ncbi:MAG TPA: translation initiation factor IF-2 [Chloroflexota bacterium]|jgi:translation initiation factor IF-2|nr:translation initiation factor IF-2 [Chloroflexota bacterium]